jgi:hypothetical protein
MDGCPGCRPTVELLWCAGDVPAVEQALRRFFKG